MKEHTKIMVGMIMCIMIILSGCGREAEPEKSASKQKPQIAKRYMYLIVPDGMGVKDMSYDVADTIGCNDLLVRVEDSSLTSPVQALEKMIAFSEMKNGYYNGLAASNLTVAHVMTDEEGHTNVYLVGELRIGGVCDAPRIQAQLERTVQQYDENALVQIFVNGVLLDDLLTQQ